MPCSVCQEIKNERRWVDADCLEVALHAIRKHFTYFKESFEEEKLKCGKLKERNESLRMMIDLLQSDKDKSLLSPKKKRRKASSLDSSEMKLKEPLADADVTIVDDSDDGAELNVALNSQQMQIMDTSVALSPTCNESIAETEKLRSPRVLRPPTSDWTRRRELLRRVKERNNSENNGPIHTSTCDGSVEGNKAEFLLKDHNYELQSPITNNSKKLEWLTKEESNPLENKSKSASAVAGVGDFQKKKAQLSLTSGRKLKQTRLQLDVVLTKKEKEVESIKHNDVIDASPNSAASLAEAKPSRSWVLRTNTKDIKCGSKDLSMNSSDISRKEKEVLKHSIGCYDDVLEFSEPFHNDTQEDNNLLLSYASDKTSSVVALTPQSPEVIFLDDTRNETYVDTNLMKSPSTVEMNKSDKEQPIETKDNAKNATVKIKVEKPSPTTKSKIETKFYDNEDDDEELVNCMPQPLPVVKTEPKHDNANHQTTAKRLNIKERFKIDCSDCQKYIDFLGDRLSDEQIEDQLRRCSRHKERDLFNQTPEGFWNPLLLSFSENDPRNEELIDDRLKNKKRLEL